MIENDLLGAIDGLSQIEKEDSIPRNVKIKIKSAMDSLNNKEGVLSLRISKSLQDLEDASDDPNLPDYIRSQIWSVVSLLESKE